MATLRNLRPAVAVLNATVATPAAKRADPHYLTPEHRAWRLEVMRRANWRCQGEGCQSPSAAGQRLFADHVVELRDGGAPFDPANGRALCGACHTRKTVQARADRMAQPT